MLKSLVEKLAKNVNFVEVVGEAVKNRRCNIAHLEPTEDSIDVSGDIDSIKAALADL